MSKLKDKKFISIVVVFYNNQREAPRTLFTLSSRYHGLHNDEFEVIAIDNNSTKPLDPNMVKSFGDNFHYHFHKTDLPSPCAALNWGIRKASSKYVMCLIDGAHMLSPGIFKNAKTVFNNFEDALVYTVPFHLGETLQNDSILTGYNQQVEDQLLNSIPWQEDGYTLFTICEIKNANHDFYTSVLESNGFIIKKSHLIEKGGFDENFVSTGGGLANLDIFKKIVEDPKHLPVSLIGEATFHQFHGGVSTNIKRKEHPIVEFRAEYKKIKGYNYTRPSFTPFYWGHYPIYLERQMPNSEFKKFLKSARILIKENKIPTAIGILKYLKERYPHSPLVYGALGLAHHKNKNYVWAEKNYLEAIKIVPSTIEPYFTLSRMYVSQGRIQDAFDILKLAEEQNIDDPRLQIRIAKTFLANEDTHSATEQVKKGVKIARSESQFLPMTYIDLSKLAHQLLDNDIALEILNKGLKANENNPKILLQLGKYYLRDNRIDEALETLNQSIKYGHENIPLCHVLLSEAYKKLNDLESAILYLKKALSLEPQNGNVRTRIKNLEQKLVLAPKTIIANATS